MPAPAHSTAATAAGSGSTAVAGPAPPPDLSVPRRGRHGSVDSDKTPQARADGVARPPSSSPAQEAVPDGVGQRHGSSSSSSEDDEGASRAMARLQLDKTSSTAAFGSDGGPADAGNGVSAPPEFVYDAKLHGRYRELDKSHAEVEIEVPNKFVGRIIGKGGSSIRELQEKTETEIHLPKDHEADENRARIVQITGRPQNVRHCAFLIQLKTVPREDAARVQELSMALRNFQTLFTRSMNIPAEHVGRVIGKSGQTIRQIQELSGAQIDLPRESRPGENFRTLTVTGSEDEVNYCCQLLLLKITPREKGGAAGPGPAFAAYAGQGGMTSLRIHIHSDQVGRIIGRKGAHIRELQDESGAMIFLPKDSIRGTSVREITVTGLPEAVTKCQSLLQQTLAQPDQEPEPLMTIPPTWAPFMPPSPMPFAMPDGTPLSAPPASMPAMYPQGPVYMDPYMAAAGGAMGSGNPPSSDAYVHAHAPFAAYSPPMVRPPQPTMIPMQPAAVMPSPGAMVMSPMMGPYLRDDMQFFLPMTDQQVTHVFGVHGEHLNELRQQTGAFVQLSQSGENSFVLMVQGMPAQVQMCRAALQSRM